MTESAYIHIPFCKQKCNYCTFVSYPKPDLHKKYIDALLKEIKTRYKGETLKTIYFGGGTPSLLKVEEIKKILQNFLPLTPNPSPTKSEGNIEITVEINPDTVDEKYLEDLKNIGVNRLSIGVQTFDNKILKIIGRTHNATKAVETVKTAQKMGFKNISLDFIYGLPTQTVEGFRRSLEIAFLLNVQHISLYGLKIEEGCYFYKNPPENLPDLDAQADFYLEAIKLCTQNGFEHYEISNFAKPDHQSRHNLNYWNNKNYYGFGCAASGYEGDIRYYNETDLERYIKNPLEKMKKDILTKTQKLEEEIFLGFRKLEGIDISAINAKYNIDFEKMYKNPLKKYLGTHILKTQKGYKLSTDGILVSNVILSEFLC